MFGSSGINVKRLTNFTGAVGYMVKPPYMGQLIRPRRGHGFVRYPWPGMPLRLRHLLFCNLFDSQYPGLTFASGEGSAILAHAKRLCVTWFRAVSSAMPFHSSRFTNTVGAAARRRRGQRQCRCFGGAVHSSDMAD
jgi:hypothetical protein